MKRMMTAAILVAFMAPMGAQVALAGPIERACMSSPRKAAGWQLLCSDGELRAAWRSVSWAVRKGDVLALRLTAAAFTDAEFARAVFRFLLPADAAEHYNGTVQA